MDPNDKNTSRMYFSVKKEVNGLSGFHYRVGGEVKMDADFEILFDYGNDQCNYAWNVCFIQQQALHGPEEDRSAFILTHLVIRPDNVEG